MKKSTDNKTIPAEVAAVNNNTRIEIHISFSFIVVNVLTHSKYQVIKTCRMVRFVNHIITTIFV